MDVHSQDKTISVTLNLKHERDGELYDSISEALEGVEVKGRHFVLKRMLRIAIKHGAIQELHQSRLLAGRSSKESLHPKAPGRHASVPNSETSASKVDGKKTLKELDVAADDDVMMEMMKENPPFG